jgi:SAM-dependent methyltransferase
MKYQDFVIKDGKFVGEFEKMYQQFEDPWDQTKKGYVENSISRQIVCNYINYFQINSIVEFGCGLGKTTNFIYENTGIDILGVDISETSIKKSKMTYPKLKFQVNDIDNIYEYKDYDCYFFSEITWYILEDNKIDKIFEIMKNSLKGKYFIHNLVFYKGQQKYGLDYFSTLDQFIEFCPFKLLSKTFTEFEESDSKETCTIFEI